MKDKRKRGSFTVEASLLMVILIPLIVSLIYLGFWLHDRTFLQGAAYEIAGAGILCDSRKEACKAMAAKKREVSQGMMFGTETVWCKLEEDEREIRVSLYAEVRIPGIAGPFFGKSRMRIRGETSFKRQRGTSAILKLSSIKKWKEGKQKHGTIF